jgi:cephalosporin hydroxylase
VSSLETALERHAAELQRRRPRFAQLHELIDSKHNLPLETWAPLFALTLDFAPDLVVEIGRGSGNSTCVFVEAASAGGSRVVSIGFEGGEGWQSHTRPRIEPVVGRDWFDRLTTLDQDITQTDFAPLVAGAERVLLFWDAHGMDVADAVFERLLPALPPENLVIVHDVADTRVDPHEYEYRAGPLGSVFDEITAIWAYLESRSIPFRTDFCLEFSVPA